MKIFKKMTPVSFVMTNLGVGALLGIVLSLFIQSLFFNAACSSNQSIDIQKEKASLIDKK